MKVSLKESPIHKPSSITLASVVAKAAPSASILGAPKSPKINMPLKIILIITTLELIQEPATTWSVIFIIAR